MTMPTASVVGPGWVDHSVNEIADLFPLSVERSFYAAIALHAPGVTTVTVGARYYALHSLVAHEKVRLDLSDEQTRALLRRAEVVLAFASLFHRLRGNGHQADAVAPHGNDYLGAQIAAGDVELDAVSALGAGTYAKASWAYWGPYRGSEMTLTTMDVRGFIPGKAYNDDRVRPALQTILDLDEDLDVLDDINSHDWSQPPHPARRTPRRRIDLRNEEWGRFVHPATGVDRQFAVLPDVQGVPRTGWAAQV